MKIAIVIERFDPLHGGAERSTAQIAEELAARGHAITIIAATAASDAPGPWEVRRRFAVKRLRAMHVWRFARWAKRELDEGGFDASLSVTTTVPATIVQPRSGTARETLERNIAMRGSSSKRATKRLTAMLSLKQQVLLALEGATMRDPRVKRIAAVSEYVARQVESGYDFDEDRIAVIPNAAAMPDLTADERATARRAVRDAFNIGDDTPAYLFLALNARLKGIDPLLLAAARCREAGHNFVLLLAGGTSYATHDTVVRLNLRDHVRIVGRTDRAADLFCAADITVHPTFYDPSSKVVIESLMMGTPAISTGYNGASDFLTGDRGIVVDEPGNVVGLADAMMLLAEPDRLAAGRAATQGLAEELSMAVHVDRLERLFEAALNDQPVEEDARDIVEQTSAS